jgi:hypothetical protein
VAITHFGEASVPADNAASNATQQTITPPGSMTTGDLVFVTCSARDAAATFSVGVSGGQTWNTLTVQTNTNIATQSFWCRYNGTWSANPRFDFSSSTCHTSVMQVFRPTGTAKLWGVDQAQSITTFTAAATITITGQTRAQASAISIAHWVTPDDNSWGNLAGSGWSKTGLSAQFRNTGGNDSSQTFAYNIGTGASNNVSQDQTANGNDAGVRSIISFYEYDDVTEWSGSGAATLPILTASGTGKRSLRGSGAAALPLATASGTGKKSRPGTGAATLPSLTGSGTGKRSLQGSGTGTLPLPTASGAGKKSRAGAGSANLPILTASGSGKKARPGSGAATLPPLEADGTGKRALGGSGDPELPLLTADGEGELAQPGVFSGSGAVVLPFPTAAGTGKRVLLGSGAAVLPFPTASGAGRRALLGSGDPSLPEITASGAGEGGSGAPIPPPLTGGGGRRTARKPRPAPEPEAASQDERDLMELIPILILRING